MRGWGAWMFVLALAGCSAEGELAVLTYNVAGLPEGISSSEPTTNQPQMGEHFTPYDLVVVQEDFAYHDLLTSGITLPYASEPKEPDEELVADGLNRFAQHPFEPVQRERWALCNGLFDEGSDCLSEKGFSWSDHTLDGGAVLHVVNHHADAGGSGDDEAARTDNFAQLAAHLQTVQGAVLVAGDTNLKAERETDAAVLADFLATTGLRDVCTELACDEDHIDRIFVRDGPDTVLTPLDWWVDEALVDENGGPLSDHPAVAARIGWSGR